MKLSNNILLIEYLEMIQAGFSRRTILSWDEPIKVSDSEKKTKKLFNYDLLKPKYKEQITTELCNGLCPYEYYQNLQEQAYLERKKQENKRIYNQINLALDQSYIDFIPTYQNNSNNYQKAKELAKKHALYKVILLLVGEQKTKKGSIQKVFTVLKDIETPKTFKSYKALSKHINKCRSNGVQSVVTHGNTGNTSTKQFNSFQFTLMEAYAAMPNMYTREMIADLVNHHSETVNLKKVSVSTVKMHLAKPEVKNRISIQRNGEKYFNDIVSPYIPRAKEAYAGNLWMMDGTPVQFYCWDDTMKKRIRLNLFVLIDVYSKKIVGYDVSLSEDRFAVINTLKMAFNMHGHLPKEILHDNFSANKTEEIKTLKYQLERSGVLFRAARPKNAQDKAQVERYFGTVQSTVFRLFDDYLGEGITSKRKEARPDQDFTRKAVKQADISMNEMKARIAAIISKYNDLQIGGKTDPNTKYLKSEKPNVIKLNSYNVPFLFWNKTSVKIARSMVQIVVKKQKHYFEIYDHDTKLKLNGTKVDVRYDEQDLAMVHLFDPETDDYICECKAIYQPAISNASQTEKDTQEIINQSAKQKSFKKYVPETLNNLMAKSLKEQGIDELQLLDPLSLDKYNVNSIESKQMEDYFLIEQGIDDSKINPLKSQQKRPTYYANPNRTKADDMEDLQKLKIKTEKPKVYIREKSPEN